MKITKITPRGFCKGVVDAWETTRQAKINNPNHQIYMIGWFVHNKDMLKEIKKEGIITIEDTNMDRLSIVKDLIKNKKKEKIIIIFSAHGTDKKAIDFVRKNKITFYDTTCDYVLKTQKLIKEQIKKNKVILYIGLKNHPEAIAVKSINSKKIHIIENKKDIVDLKCILEEAKIFVTNQTTMSMYDFHKLIKLIKEIFKYVEFKNDICLAAYDRQKAIIDMPNDVDLLIVVGDKKSNNSNKMVEVGRNKNIESYLVENEKDINLKWFKNKIHIAISSGASTPTWITKKVINYIENINI